MTTVTSPTALIETHFGGIKDPRAAHSIAWRVTRNAIEHKLIDILIITICATICGANDRSAITQYGRAKQEWLKTWLELPNGIPSPDTFNRVFARLKPEELQKCFVGWMQDGTTTKQVSGIKYQTQVGWVEARETQQQQRCVHSRYFIFN